MTRVRVRVTLTLTTLTLTLTLTLTPTRRETASGSLWLLGRTAGEEVANPNPDPGPDPDPYPDPDPDQNPNPNPNPNEGARGERQWHGATGRAAAAPYAACAGVAHTAGAAAASTAAAASEDGRSRQAQDRPGAPCGRQDGARRDLGSARSVYLVAHQVRVRVKGSGSR